MLGRNPLPTAAQAIVTTKPNKKVLQTVGPATSTGQRLLMLAAVLTQLAESKDECNALASMAHTFTVLADVGHA